MSAGAEMEVCGGLPRKFIRGSPRRDCFSKLGSAARSASVAEEESLLVSGEVENVASGLHIHVAAITSPCAIGATPLLMRSPAWVGKIS